MTQRKEDKPDRAITSPHDGQQEEAAMRILVVYFSRSGTTEAVANEIARALGADVEALREPKSRLGPFGALRSVFDVLTRRRAKLEPLNADPARYDLVILGTPVWASRASTPITTFIAAHKLRLKHVAFFCTQIGEGGDKVMAELTDTCGRSPVATLILSAPQIQSHTSADYLERFLESLEAFIEDNGRLRPVA